MKDSEPKDSTNSLHSFSCCRSSLSNLRWISSLDIPRALLKWKTCRLSLGAPPATAYSKLIPYLTQWPNWDLGQLDLAAARWDHEPFDIPLAELRRISDAERRKYVHTATLREAELSAPPFHSSKRIAQVQGGQAGSMFPRRRGSAEPGLEPLIAPAGMQFHARNPFGSCLKTGSGCCCSSGGIGSADRLAWRLCIAKEAAPLVRQQHRHTAEV